MLNFGTQKLNSHQVWLIKRRIKFLKWMRIFEAGKLEVPKICGNWALKVQRQEEDWTFIKATFASALHVCLLLLITVTSQKRQKVQQICSEKSQNSIYPDRKVRATTYSVLKSSPADTLFPESACGKVPEARHGVADSNSSSSFFQC